MGSGDLEVNCPEGAREGGLGHWVLSIPGKYRAAGGTSHSTDGDHHKKNNKPI